MDNNKVSQPAFFERLWEVADSLKRLWLSSLRLRVVTLILVGGSVGAGIIGVVITSQMRTAFFEQAVQSNLNRFSSEVTSGEKRFSGEASYTSGQIQETANALVASMYDPEQGLLGATLMRSADQEASSSQIYELSTSSAAVLRSLITQDLRDAVTSGGHIAWQSVAVPADLHESYTTSEFESYRSEEAGIVVGKAIDIPNAGRYELYALYSLHAQEQLLDSTYKVLSFGIVALIVGVFLLIVLILRLVLRPIKEAAQGADDLAQGALDTRMAVVGSDELAQLATSFNQMASSIEDQFARMERMSQVQTQFVSAVSHELRSPVTTIRMAGQLMYDKRDELPQALKRSVELQHDQLINLDSMLADLLEISRYDAGAMNVAAQTADIADIVRAVIEMVQPLADDNGVDISLDVYGDVTAEIEPRRIERIVRNLVVNAVEHGESRPVCIRVVANETAVAVEVADRGIGLSSEQAEHVFDRFWRADTSRVRKTGGTGLGLTIAREDALIHGGTLDVAGTLGVGTVFLLVVPKTLRGEYTPPIKLTPPVEVNVMTDEPEETHARVHVTGIEAHYADPEEGKGS